MDQKPKRRKDGTLAKGHSGNPGGKPKSALIRQLFFADHPDRSFEQWPGTLTRTDEIACYRRLMDIVIKGRDQDSIKAIDVLHNRVYGRTPVIDFEGETVKEAVAIVIHSDALEE